MLNWQALFVNSLLLSPLASAIVCSMTLNEFLSRRNAVADLAAAIGIAPSVVSQWKNGVRRVPLDHCPAIERASNGLIRCEELRPDFDWAYLRGTSAVNPKNPPIPERKAA